MTEATEHEVPTVEARVRAEMGRQRVSQNTLSQQTGIPQSNLSRRLTGETEFTVAELLKVARALAVPVGDLLGPDGASPE